MKGDIGCLRHKTSLVTQRVYSITLQMVRDRIKLAVVPEFTTNRSRLRTRAPTGLRITSCLLWAAATRNFLMAYITSLFLLCVITSQAVSLKRDICASFPNLPACVRKNAFFSPSRLQHTLVSGFGPVISTESYKPGRNGEFCLVSCVSDSKWTSKNEDARCTDCCCSSSLEHVRMC